MKVRELQIWSNIKEKRMKEDVKHILNTLIKQSLIKVDKSGIIRIHNQLQDIDRKIIEIKIEYKDTQI